jgi:tRNA(Ile)-lysidine synthase
MLEKITENLQKSCHLQPDQLILVGVSGGPDSIFLLDVLHQLGYNLVIAHLDHQLRPESSQEADGVKRVAAQLNIPVLIESLDVGKYAKTQKLSIEQAARQLRYEFLFRQAEMQKAQAVAIGHTADDQVETVLLHLLRGTGLSGLAGMKYFNLPNPWSQTIPLVRPIMDIWRHQILEYLADKPYNPYEDMSNLDTKYFRNRIRHELIPFLEKFNPRIRQNLFQMSGILEQDEQVLHATTQRAWNQCLISAGKDYLQFNTVVFSEQPLGIQRRLVRNAFMHLLPDLNDIEFQNIEQVIQFLKEPPKSNFSRLAAGLQLYSEKNSFHIFNQLAFLPGNQWPQLQSNASINLEVPGELNLGEGWLLISQVVENTPKNLSDATSNPDPYLAWMDFDQITLPLTLRCRQPGDYFQPLGLSGKTQKISDFFINQKLPRRARPNWPILTSPGEIIWIPGFQIAHHTRVSPDTKRIIHFKLERKPAISK